MSDVILMSVWVIGMFLLRTWIIDDGNYSWFLSNLRSGFVPLVTAYLIYKFYPKLKPWLFYIGAFIWFIFYPNSPYMVSDIIHVNANPDYVFIDALVIYSLGLLSIYYGLLSVKIMYQVFKKRFGKGKARAIITFAMVMACVAFVIGRVPPVLYSHEIYTDPWKVITVTWEHFFPIGENIMNYWLMLLFGGIQAILLVMMRDISGIEQKGIPEPPFVEEAEIETTI